MSYSKLGESVVCHIKRGIQWYMINVKIPTFLWPTGEAYGIFFIWIKAQTAQIFILPSSPLSSEDLGQMIWNVFHVPLNN